MSETKPRWKDTTAGIVRYMPRSDGTVDVQLADAGYLNALEAKADLVQRLAEALRLTIYNRKGYCRECMTFGGYDRIQGIQGDEPHENGCSLIGPSALLAEIEEARR